MAQTTCLHCQKPMEPGHFGACLVVAGQLYSGHYGCVLEALGPTAALAAIRSGALPNVADDALVDGRLKKFSERKKPSVALLTMSQSGVLPIEGATFGVTATQKKKELT